MRSDELQYLKAWAVYFLVVEVFVLGAILLFNGSFAEHVARAWLLLLVLLARPLNGNIRYRWAFPAALITVTSGVLAHFHVVYELKRYEATAPFQTTMVLVSIVYYLSVQCLASYVASHVDSRFFSRPDSRQTESQS